jgi:hypothetical protein
MGNRIIRLLFTGMLGSVQWVFDCTDTGSLQGQFAE